MARQEARQAWREGVYEEPSDRPLPAEYQTLPVVADPCWTAHPEITTIWPEDLTGFDAWAQKELP